MELRTLKRPFKWEERKVLLQDQILYVPDFLENYQESEIPSWSTLFGNNNPIHIEYCSGNGSWIVQKALDFQDTNWIAVELKFERVKKIWSKMKHRSLKNLWIICGEAQLATSHFISPKLIEEIYINFPDPWPKKRHWKHRLLQESFFKEMDRILKPQGKFTFVTDDIDYSEVVIQDVHQFSSFTSRFQNPSYQTELPNYGSSYFEDLWRSKGKEIRYHQWQK